MMPTTNLNVNASDSCNNWVCCPWRKRAPSEQKESPVSEIVDTVEKVHTVYHQHAAPSVQKMRTETRTPTPSEPHQRDVTMVNRASEF
jgi:hypothetical protein